MNRLIVMLFMCLLASAASAINLRFLKDSVLSRFTEAEMTEFRALVSDSMTNAKDGTVVEWHSGPGKISARVLFRGGHSPSTAEINGLTCRETAFSIINRSGQTFDGRYTLCKHESGDWKLIGR